MFPLNFGSNLLGPFVRLLGWAQTLPPPSSGQTSLTASLSGDSVPLFRGACQAVCPVRGQWCLSGRPPTWVSCSAGLHLPSRPRGARPAKEQRRRRIRSTPASEPGRAGPSARALPQSWLGQVMGFLPSGAPTPPRLDLCLGPSPPLARSSAQECAGQGGTLRGTRGSQRRLSPCRALFPSGPAKQQWGEGRAQNRACGLSALSDASSGHGPVNEQGPYQVSPLHLAGTRREGSPAP